MIKLFLIRFIFIFIVLSVLICLVFKFIPPSHTPLMIIRSIHQLSDEKKKLKLKKDWVSIKNISPNLIQAAVAGEDQNFMYHYGFDFKAMKLAFSNNKKGRRIKGGSTISQQTAKNVFCWPSRSYVRKAFEAWFTLLIECCWSKKRIMEQYLNIIEMGDGIYGCEAAAKTYFNKSAKNLTKSEAALIVACLPNPRKWNPAKPTDYILKRKNAILTQMDRIEKIKFYIKTN